MNNIDELEKEIKALKQTVSALEREIDDLMKGGYDSIKVSKDIRDLQEAVANIVGQPVGMIFDYRA